MNNIFDIKRFGDYFLYDLRRAKNNYGLSLLLMGLIPVILYIAYLLISLLNGNGVGTIPEAMKYSGIVLVWFVVILGAGAKIYGTLTEKRAGTDFLLLPVSTTEKWLSMSLMVCVVLPLALSALLLASDGLMSLVFPNSYGSSLLSLHTADSLSGILEEEGVKFNLPAILFFNWCVNVLTFTLGAVCFKKAKVAKTIFCLFGISIVLSMLSFLILGTGHFDFEQIAAWFDSPDKAASFLNWMLSILYFLLIGGLLTGLWFRLRTLKH